MNEDHQANAPEGGERGGEVPTSVTGAGHIFSIIKNREHGNMMYSSMVKASEDLAQKNGKQLPEKFFLAVKVISTFSTDHMPIDRKRLEKTLLQIHDEAMKTVPEKNIGVERLVSLGHIETLFTILIQDILGARKRNDEIEKNKNRDSIEATATDTKTSTTKTNTLLKCADEDVVLASNLLEIVQECLKHNPYFDVLHLATDYQLLEALFSLLTTKFQHRSLYHLRETVSSIMDSILCSESDAPPVDLKLVNGLSEVLNAQTGTQETHLFHVLSAMLSVSEFNAIAHSSLEKYDAWMIESGFSDVMESNHRFLLDIPNWLENMCTLVCRPMTEVTKSVENMNQIFQRLDLAEGDMDMLSHDHHFRDHDGLFYQILLYKEKAFRGDIFLLLSLLLGGKFRDEVQNRLVDCQCLSRLPTVFQEVVWIVFQGHVNLLIQGNVSRDECCLDMFVRIQFLRFIYSIADNHSNRYLLLSDQDVVSLRKIAEERNLEFPPSLQELVDKKLFTAGTKGVLMELIHALKQEPASSCVRFWITRALEAFLRGETIALNQAFLLEQSLVEDTVSLIISGSVQNEMVMQGSFDFLSTLMKFNSQAFKRCDKVLDCTDKLTTLIRLTSDNLVDSNMFLRCIILTASHIVQKLPEQIGFLKDCRLLQYFAQVDKQVDFAVKLNRLLTVSTLSQVRRSYTHSIERCVM